MAQIHFLNFAMRLSTSVDLQQICSSLKTTTILLLRQLLHINVVGTKELPSEQVAVK